jgi:hypothetical protein
MNKPFFVKLVAADLLLQVFRIPPGGHENWLRTFAEDLVQGEGRTEYSRSLLSEAQEYSRKMSENGRKGGRPKAK